MRKVNWYSVYTFEGGVVCILNENITRTVPHTRTGCGLLVSFAYQLNETLVHFRVFNVYFESNFSFFSHGCTAFGEPRPASFS